MSVFGNSRTIESPEVTLPEHIKLNTDNVIDGIEFLNSIADNTFPVAFFDPQYRGVLDKLSYGNEGVSRGKERFGMPQMTDDTIIKFISMINDVLMPSGHLFLWMDKFHICEGFRDWILETDFHVVDMIVWNKSKMGMGYRSRRVSEYCVVLQKEPKRAKGVWTIHNIRDVWTEKISDRVHVHQKPFGLHVALIEAVTNEGDVVIDPAAGSYTVMEAAKSVGRNFLGCDINVFKRKS